MDIMLWTCAGIALVSALLAVAFLPRRTRRDASQQESVLVATGETDHQRAELGT
jgi:hypothetical protein